MRRLIFQVAVGQTPEFYVPCVQSVAAYAERIGADHEILTEPELRIVPKASQRSENALRLGYLPIYEKEAALGRFGRYSDIAIVDADIYVMPHAPDIFEEARGHAFAGVVERDLPLLPQYQAKMRNYSRDQYDGLKDVDWKWGRLGAEFYNMGMMVLSDSILPHLHGQAPREFIQRPEFERFVNGEGKWRWSTDQTLLNWWVKKSGMTRKNLNWRWNCLYSYVEPEAFKKRPYFIHFNLAANFPRKGAEIPEIIEGLLR